MNDKIKRFAFYNVFFLCAIFGMFIFLNVNSFASGITTNKNFNFSITGLNTYQGLEDTIWNYRMEFTSDVNAKFCIVFSPTPNSRGGNGYLMSNVNVNVPCNIYYENQLYQETTFKAFSAGDGLFHYSEGNSFSGNRCFAYINTSMQTNDLYIFSTEQSARDYLINGTLPQIPYDDSLELDSFKVTSWAFGNFQLIFSSKFVVEWSDPRISTVQVVLSSTNGSVSFESSSSPFKQKFEPENYVLKKGDIVHLVATPYMSDGTYGVSLYQSFVYSDDVPGSNIYRKFTNTPYNDNTLTIPYTGVSGQPQSVTLPVDGVTTNNVYKVQYNPITYEYGDLNIYEVYYSPVLIYPDNTTDEEVDETQDVVNNTYTTNNYYETTKNINIDFDVSFGDISGSDIQHGYDDFGNFSNGFGGFIGKLSSWVLALFPFLSPVVASAIVFMFGLIILIAIIALVLKIVSVIADLIPL